MLPKTKRLFISYRSKDSAQVDRIAHHLRLLTYDDGTARYIPWQDKRDLTSGVTNWWDAILDAIEASDLFVFHLTLESVKSELCRAELDYAYQLNLPIVVVVLEGAYTSISESGNYQVKDEIQALLPKWIHQTQWLFYHGPAEFFIRFQTAVEYHERKWLGRTPAKRPLHPGSGHTYNNPYDLYDEACECAYKLDFKEAEDLFRQLVRRNLADFADIAKQWLELLQRYDELILIDSKPRTRFKFKEKWDVYRTLFPKNFLDDGEIFDPKGFATRNHVSEPPPPPPIVKPVDVITTPPPSPITTPAKVTAPAPNEPKAKEVPPVIKPVNNATTPPPSPIATPAPSDSKAREVPPIVKPRSQDLMPAPFAWIEIPGGQGTMQTNQAKVTLTIPTERYWIAKYPVTNAQYAVFINDGGYQEKKWWTERGWQAQKKENRTEPRFWHKPPWNQGDHPVVGISWFEAVAFCLWLSDQTAETIMLPTEAQWQYAAQGNYRRVYPWGNEWDCQRCNNSVIPCNSRQTTAVTHYEGKGDSPFGVVDMAGNVQEWCLTDYKTNKNDITLDADYRVLRGGAWYFSYTDYFRCGYRDGYDPHYWYNDRGFRLSRSGSLF
jgi:formylglycine-generating enzyme required for sulfatase activity